MRTYALRPKAQGDLVKLADYTLEEWGVEQEKLYLRMLQRSLQSLAENPNLGRPFDEVSLGLRRLLAGERIILYFVSHQYVDVVRILHHSMDVGNEI